MSEEKTDLSGLKEGDKGTFSERVPGREDAKNTVPCVPMKFQAARLVNGHADMTGEGKCLVLALLPVRKDENGDPVPPNWVIFTPEHTLAILHRFGELKGDLEAGTPSETHESPPVQDACPEPNCCQGE